MPQTVSNSCEDPNDEMDKSEKLGLHEPTPYKTFSKGPVQKMAKSKE